MIPLSLVSFLGLLPGAAAAAPPLRPAKLPIREVALYRSGVGAFLRAGDVEGDVLVRMTFPTESVNDILKTLTFLDLGGGRLGPVSYDSLEPLERRLRGFRIDLSARPSLEQLLAQLLGERLTVSVGSRREQGTVLAVEPRIVPVTQDQTARHPFVDLLTERGVVSVDLFDVQDLSLDDPALASELEHALSAFAEQRADRFKDVSLTLLGPPGRKRTVAVAYVREMPVWKTTYRLVLPDEDGGGLRLQGFAIVENTTDDDWTDVRLSLAAGRPVAFTMDLYQPLFSQRPDLPVPLEGRLVARLYESGAPAEPGRTNARPGPGTPAGFVGRLAEKRRKSIEDVMEEEVEEAKDSALFKVGGGSGGRFGGRAMDLGAAVASGGAVGGQFFYTVDTAVTLKRRRSAMIPILLAEVDGERISILTAENVGGPLGLRVPAHPLLGARFLNSSGLHLMPGPIAVFDGGRYAGDSRIDHTARGERRMLAYAMDLDLRSSVDGESRDRIVRVVIRDGTLRRSVERRRRVVYRFENHDARRDRLVLVEHPRRPEWELVAPKNAAEETDTMRRFEVAVPAGEEASLVVEERHVLETSVLLTRVSLDELLVFTQDGRASQAVLDAARKAAGLQAEVQRLEGEIQRLDQERGRIATEQERIRQNLARLAAGTDLYQRYVDKLAAQEDRLDAIAKQRAQFEEDLVRSRRQLEDFLKDLDVD